MATTTPNGTPTTRVVRPSASSLLRTRKSAGQSRPRGSSQAPGGSGVLFVGVGLGLGPVDRAGRVLGSGVDRVELEVDRALVHEVVARAGGDVDEATGRHRAALALEDGHALALDEDEDLVHVVVNLLADLARWRDAHHDDLGVWPGRDDLAEERVALRSGEDVLVERHGDLLGGECHGDLLVPRVCGRLPHPARAERPVAGLSGPRARLSLPGAQSAGGTEHEPQPP